MNEYASDLLLGYVKWMTKRLLVIVKLLQNLSFMENETVLNLIKCDVTCLIPCACWRQLLQNFEKRNWIKHLLSYHELWPVKLPRTAR